MRILHIIDSGGMYGAEVMLLSLIEEQVKQGGHPIIASIGDKKCGNKPFETEARKRNLPVKIFRMRPGPNLLGSKCILNYAKATRCDLLHSHGYKGNILLGFTPKIIRQLPLIATVHGWTSTSTALTRMRLYEWLDARALPRMDAVVLVNKEMLNHPQLAHRKGVCLHVVNNGISTREPIPCPCELLDLKSDTKFHIVAVGRLSPEKGFDILLEAMARLLKERRDISLVIFGEGKERAHLEALIGQHHLQNHVSLPGFINNGAAVFPCFDFLVMPSLTEGLPMTLLEAMRVKLPVIASSVGGVPNVLKHDVNGMLVASGSSEELAVAISNLADSPNCRLRFAESAHFLFTQKYSAVNMAESYRQIYAEVLL